MGAWVPYTFSLGLDLAMAYSNSVRKVQARPKYTAYEFQARQFFLNNFSVRVKIRTSGYQTLECFIATLPTGRLVNAGETCNRFADSGL